MRLNQKGIQDKHAWEGAGYRLPQFDREKMIERTKREPRWIHFGAGNIFRAFQANVVQNLLNDGILDTGLTVAEGFDYEIIEKMNRPHDDLSILVTLKADGTVEKTVVGSIAESLVLDSQNQMEFERLKEIFRNPSLQMASFTITEKGYSLVDGKGDLLSAVQKDQKEGPAAPASYLGKVVSLLYERYTHGACPIAMVSMDNCSHNGSKLYQAVKAFAAAWCEKGLTDAGFEAYIDDAKKVSFPWTMIDKITPRPDPAVRAMIEKDAIEGLAQVVTSKNTYVAPFVNAEESEYLVIEDLFPNGRPALEKGGLIFTDRETVNKVERMKVCTCLNPLHTALAIFGCLLGYDLISKEMEHPQLKKLVERIGYQEGLPVVVDPGIIEPKKFLDQVLQVRIPNPFMPDTPQRIATDTSQKLAIRFGETIKAYQRREDLQVSDLRMIPLVFAGWLRYLMGVDDRGVSFVPSPDPLLETAGAYVRDIRLGEAFDPDQTVGELLKNASVFGVDLYEVGLAGQVLDEFREMTEGPGAVAHVLKKYVG